MENASKALIMAGGILVGVLVLSLMVYLFADFGSTSAQINAQNKYTNYNISSTNLKNDTIKYANMMVDLATKYTNSL